MLMQLFERDILYGIVISMLWLLVTVAAPSAVRPAVTWILGIIAGIGFHWRAAAGFALTSCAGYFIAVWLSRPLEAERRWRRACLAIPLLVVVFTMGRIWQWERPWLLGSTALIVYSLDMWHALKFVTLFWEIGSGTVSLPPPSRFTLWVCLPLTIAGPLLRLSQLPTDIVVDARAFTTMMWWREAATATGKLALGGGLGLAAAVLFARLPEYHYFNNAVATFVTGPFGFYLTMAGYCHWMELLGRACGIVIPVSFDRPIGRRNIAEFWMNWNMTATSVFRDYVFFNRWGLAGYNIYANTMILFLLVGLWHAPNAYWLLWGTLHGLLFCAFLYWRYHLSHGWQVPPGISRIVDISSGVLTYVCVCMCWYLPSKILQKVKLWL